MKARTLNALPKLTADAAAEPAFAAARDVCRREFKDVFFAAAFLPTPKRRAIHAIVSFCKMVADALAQSAAGGETSSPSAIGSSSCGANTSDQTIALVVDRLDQIYESRLDLPLPEFRDSTQHILYAFAKTTERYSIPKQLFL